MHLNLTRVAERLRNGLLRSRPLLYFFFGAALEAALAALPFNSTRTT